MNIQYVRRNYTFVRKHLIFSSDRIDWYLDENRVLLTQKLNRHRHPDHFIDNEQLGCESFCNVSNNNFAATLFISTCLVQHIGSATLYRSFVHASALNWGDLMFSTQMAPYYLWCSMSTQRRTLRSHRKWFLSIYAHTKYTTVFVLH